RTARRANWGLGRSSPRPIMRRPGSRRKPRRGRSASGPKETRRPRERTPRPSARIRNSTSSSAHCAPTTNSSTTRRPSSFRRSGAGGMPLSGFPRLLRRGRAVWILLVLVVLLGIHLSSGFYVVGTDERAVVRRFGAVTAQVGPGMHYRLPWPADRVDVLKTTSVMKVGVGFAPPER